MIFNEPNPRLKEIAERMKLEAEAQAQSLNSGVMKVDYNAILGLIQTAELLEVLTQIRDELRLANHTERMKLFPNSMLNTKPTGVSP
jgi:hypothetical protein